MPEVDDDYHTIKMKTNNNKTTTHTQQQQQHTHICGKQRGFELSSDFEVMYILCVCVCVFPLPFIGFVIVHLQP